MTTAKTTLKFLAAGFFLIAGAAIAAEATDPDVIARQDLMKTIGMNTKILGDMAGGKADFDMAKADTAKVALAEAAGMIEAKFTPQATDPASEAKADIWTNWEDYLKNANALNAAALAVDTASPATIGAGMGAIGGACKDCHTTFRAKL